LELRSMPSKQLVWRSAGGSLLWKCISMAVKTVWYSDAAFVGRKGVSQSRLGISMDTKLSMVFMLALRWNILNVNFSSFVTNCSI
jgi:hypothetical protein